MTDYSATPFNLHSSDPAEAEQMAQAEIERLQKQLRLLQNENGVFTLDVKIKERNCENIIELLKREQNTLQNELFLLERGSHKRKEKMFFKKIKRTEKDQNELHYHISTIKKYLLEIEGQIRKLSREISRLRCDKEILSVPVLELENAPMKIQKTINKLENNLEVAKKRCSGILAENIDLRNEINHMVHERSLFNNYCEKMITEFNQRKKLIMDLTEMGTATFEQREELRTQLHTLRDKSEIEKNNYMQEMRDLQRKIDHDEILQDFYTTKGFKRQNSELDEIQQNKKQLELEELEKQMANYNKILERIQSFCDMQEIDKMIKAYKKQEDENFALFNYVNELSHEVEVLQESVQNLEISIDHQKMINENKEALAVDNVENLERLLSVARIKMERATAARTFIENILNDLLIAIETLYFSVQSDKAPVLNLLGQEKKVTLFNIKLFLGIVRKRTNNMINQVNQIYCSSEQHTARTLARPNRLPRFNIKRLSMSRSPVSSPRPSTDI